MNSQTLSRENSNTFIQSYHPTHKLSKPQSAPAKVKVIIIFECNIIEKQ